MTLADGTAVTAGSTLTPAQLAGLLFKPTTGQFGTSSAFGYTVADPAGNTSAGNATLAIGPTAPTALALATVSNSGVPSDDRTNVAQPTITGLSTAGDTVTLLDKATPLGTVLVAADGTWSVTPATALVDGAHTLTATATDVAGNTSAISAALSLTIDGTAPATPGTLALAPASDSGTLGDGITSDTTPTLTGTAEAGSTVTLTDTRSGTAPVLGTALADSAGVWSFTAGAALASGAHSVTATATDAAGNTSLASAPLALTLDTTAPVAPAITSPALINVAAPVLAGTAEAGDAVTVAVAGATYATRASSNGAWSIDLATAVPTAGTLALNTNGSNAITASAQDPAGNPALAAATQALAIDTTAPAVTAVLAHDTGPSSTDAVTADPTLAGTGDPGATVTLTEGAIVLSTATAAAAGAWRFTPALADGPHSVMARETDAAGNTASATASFTLLATAPAAPAGLALLPASDSGTPGDGLTNVARPTLTGTAELGSAVTLYNGTTAIGIATADAHDLCGPSPPAPWPQVSTP